MKAAAMSSAGLGDFFIFGHKLIKQQLFFFVSYPSRRTVYLLAHQITSICPYSISRACLFITPAFPARCARRPVRLPSSGVFMSSV
jgi:hypothetical protein